MFINLITYGYIMNTFTKFITITSTALLMAAPLYASQGSSPDSGFEQQQQPVNRALNVNNQDNTQLHPPIAHLTNFFPDEVCLIIGKNLAFLEALDSANKIDSSTANLAKLGYKLALLTKNWKNIAKTGMQVNTPLWKILHGIETPEDEAIFQIFSKAKLVYKPDQNSDKGKIELLFSEFANPFNDTFDLSKCGNANEYIRITTSPSAFLAVEDTYGNSFKTIVLIAPHFLINKYKYNSTTPKHFEQTLQNWNKAEVPFGIFYGSSASSDYSNVKTEYSTSPQITCGIYVEIHIEDKRSIARYHYMD